MDFISTPVMGGFISGIAVAIILMQILKLLGSPAGTGELMELLRRLELHIDDLPPQVREKSPLVLSLIERKRRLLRARLFS